MNLVLFEAGELESGLPIDDPRSIHIKRVLRRSIGDQFDCGLINGPRGRATLRDESATTLRFTFTWGRTPPPLDPITLLIGLPRPQTARKILSEMSAIGVARLRFFQTARGEPSYGSSHLWTSGEVRRLLVAGAQQAFCTHLPDVSMSPDLNDALSTVDPHTARIGLDNYEGIESLATLPLFGAGTTLALGSERGWDSNEREQLRHAGFTIAHLGARVLRTETACVAATILLKARLNLL